MAPDYVPGGADEKKRGNKNLDFYCERRRKAGEVCHIFLKSRRGFLLSHFLQVEDRDRFFTRLLFLFPSPLLLECVGQRGTYGKRERKKKIWWRFFPPPPRPPSARESREDTLKGAFPKNLRPCI